MNSIKIMIFLWQIGVVDSLTLMQFCINCASQYTGLTLAEVANYMGDMGNLRPDVLLAPIHELSTSYKYVRAAQGAIERRARVATLASFMVMSDPASSENVGHIIDLSYVPAHEKAIVRQTILQGARDKFNLEKSLKDMNLIISTDQNLT